ncbi:MAG: hypothetical protein JRI95_11195 [Deltaproteobacteria bacterium]|nr:hypothetical protein [Deltaproteobacteria bacterium]MBW2084982.1 hypothetical protein [Deltaproteobacteria bacterium]
MRQRKYHGFIGLAILVISEGLMLAGVHPFTTWFYSLAWWSYILIVDQVVYHLKGNSLWVNRRREFLLLIPCSVFFWMIFEGINVYLKNWHYINVPGETWIRWCGYFIAYSTVLPALFETTELLESLGLYQKNRVRPIPKSRSWYLPFTMVGLFFLFAPIFWPRFTFPVVWLSFIFLFEPILHARGGRSLMLEWEQGSLRTLFLLLTAGLICGLLWEFWNFWTTTKWVYTVPFFSWLKIFEMPVLGFLGFLPFTVECYVMYNFVTLLRGAGGWTEEESERPGRTSPPFIILGLLIFVFVFVLVSRSIDFYNVRSFF